MSVPVADAGRRLALFFCGRLTDAVPEVKWLPEHGEDPNDPIEPPFGVPLIIEMNEINTETEAYSALVHIAFQSHPAEMKAEVHADLARKVKDALDSATADAPGYDTTNKIYINGIVVGTQHPTTGDQAHGTIIEVRVGCQIVPPS